MERDDPKAVQLAREAVQKMIVIKQLPLMFVDVAPDNISDAITIHLINKKLRTKTHDLGDFYVPIFMSTLTDMNTMGLDLSAAVPSDADDDTRRILRIAFVCYNAYINNILKVYEQEVNPSEPSKRCIACAVEWYEGL